MPELREILLTKARENIENGTIGFDTQGIKEQLDLDDVVEKIGRLLDVA